MSPSSRSRSRSTTASRCFRCSARTRACRAGIRHPGVPGGARRLSLDDRPAAARAHGGPALHRRPLPAIVPRIPHREARRPHGQPHARRQQPGVRAPSRDPRSSEARENGSPLSLCLVDVDDFKQINDSTAIRSGTSARPGRAAARVFRREPARSGFGGDEFAVLVAGGERPHGGSRGALPRISSAEFPHGEAATVSVGIATFPVRRAERGGARAQGRRRALLGKAQREEPALPLRSRSRAELLGRRRRAARGDRRRGSGPRRTSHTSST